jgi:hypothetical protein
MVQQIHNGMEGQVKAEHNLRVVVLPTKRPHQPGKYPAVSLVKVELGLTRTVQPVAEVGTAVAEVNTTLAVVVGLVMLVALLQQP